MFVEIENGEFPLYSKAFREKGNDFDYLISSAFQDRLVMTASIRLHAFTYILYPVQTKMSMIFTRKKKNSVPIGTEIFYFSYVYFIYSSKISAIVYFGATPSRFTLFSTLQQGEWNIWSMEIS